MTSRAYFAAPGKYSAEIDEVLGGGSRVAVDHLVVVADPEAVRGWAAEQPNQQHVGRIEILELVNQQVPTAPLGRAPCLGITYQDLDCSVDLLVEVHGSRRGHRFPVGVESFGQALSVWEGLLDHFRRRKAQPNGRHRIDVGEDGVCVGLAANLEHLLDELPYLWLFQNLQAPRSFESVADEQADAVERPDVGTPRRHEIAASLRELVGGLLVVGEHRHGGWVDPALLQEVAEPLGQDPSLPRARWSDDPCATGGMADGGQLVRRQVGLRLGVTNRPE